MKKVILTLVLLFSLKSGYSQYYTFSQLNQAYGNITGGTVVSTPSWDYVDVFTVPFPFQFKYFGADFDTFYVSGGFGGFTYYGGGVFGNYELFFYDAPMMDLGNNMSPISYSVTGSAPNRILKMQVQNAGFAYDQTFSDFVDVQVWFYETTNVVEIHNGPSSVLNNASWYPTYAGPTVALVRDSLTFLQLYGQASNASSSTNNVANYVTGAPPVTSVYRFSPLFNGIEQIDQLAVSVFPNPSTGDFNVNTTSLKSGGELSVYNLTGELVFHQNVEPAINRINLDFPSGIYILKISSSEGQMIQRLVINR